MSAKKSPWPEIGLVATIHEYGGEDSAIENGKTVEVQGYHPFLGYFECIALDDPAQGIVLCTRAELISGNDHTKEYLDNCVEAGVEMYDDQVYELRDALDKLGIAVTAASIDEWTPEQRHTIQQWINAINAGVFDALKPKELGP